MANLYTYVLPKYTEAIVMLLQVWLAIVIKNGI